MARLHAELEQARVATDDARQESETAGRECRRLTAALELRTHAQRATETTLSDLRGQLGTTSVAMLALEADQARGTVAEEELRVTVEELQVLAEELETANEALRNANQDLDLRVEERTRELDETNQALRRSEARLNQAMRHAGAGTWEWDIPADRIAWSDELLQLCGRRRDEVAPSRRGWLDLIMPEDRAGADRALRDCLVDREENFAVEHRIRHPHHGVRWLIWRGQVTYDGAGRPLCKRGLTIDITKRKQAELGLAQVNAELNQRVEAEVAAREAVQRQLFQQQKLESIGRLTGGVAHDFNNLLTVVTSGLHLLSHTQDPDRREVLIGRLGDAARRGAELTQRLLAFARRQELRPQPLDLTSRMPELRALLAHSLRLDLRIETAAENGLWPVEVDSGALELALLNLTVNARDAMPGPGRVVVAARNRALAPEAAALLGLPPGDYVEISVADTGAGMAPEVMAQAFEPFFTTKPHGKGTGLGLSQVYGFAKQSGGTARVESAPDEGTTVSLILPRTHRLPEHPSDPDPRTEPEPGGCACILVVEDDDEVAELVLDLLDQIGHEAIRVSSAAAALGALGNGRTLDLMFTDVLLPGGMSGLDLAREAARRRPGLAIVLTSGYGGEQGAELAEAGFPLLRKPYEPEQLDTVLNEALARRPG